MEKRRKKNYHFIWKIHSKTVRMFKRMKYRLEDYENRTVFYFTESIHMIKRIL